MSTRAGIVRDGFDAWGVHPGGFNNAPRQEIGSPRGEGWNGHASFYFQRFIQHREVMEAFDDGAKPIWITEMGWSTANQDPAYGYGVDNSEADQAEFLTDAIRPRAGGVRLHHPRIHLESQFPVRRRPGR